MNVRAKIAWTIVATGLLTALGVVATVLVGFQRFEHESSYYRASAFLERVVIMVPDMLEAHERRGEELTEFLRSLVLLEPDTQLYLLDATGTVLATSGRTTLVGAKVKLEPVMQAAGPVPMPYVMGDDPERMEADAVIAAKPVRRSTIGASAAVAGYLYLVCHKPALPQGRLQALRASLAWPTLGSLLVLVGLTTLLAAAVVASVTRPLRQLSDAVARVAREGLGSGATAALPALPASTRRDEFGRLAQGFSAMLAALQQQWQALQRLDHFRREGVSNLSHDLRSPLTATATCLETLDARLASQPQRQDDRALLAVALRNTRNAARLVQSLGDLAQLDEPQFKLHRERVDLNELLDDIALRFAAKIAAGGMSPPGRPKGECRSAQHEGSTVTLSADLASEPVVAQVDVQLIERAVANLVDNALKHGGPGVAVRLSAEAGAREVTLCVVDNGAGIAAAELPHLFDRFYQPRHNAAPAMGEGGKGLGLAIVKRIAELHGGKVEVLSTPGQATRVTMWLPLDAAV